MIVFDFDGTLTVRSEINVWERLWLRLGYTQNDCSKLAMEFFRGRLTHEEWCNETLKFFRARNLTEAMVREVAIDIKLLDGFTSTLQRLKDNGIKLFITSGSVFTIISEALGDHAGLFETIEANYFSFDRNGVIEKITGTLYDFDGKADFITKTAAKFKFPPNEVLFVGNSINDVKAKKSGARTLLVNPHFTHPSEIEVWDDCIHKMSNLNDIIPFVGDLPANANADVKTQLSDRVIDALWATEEMMIGACSAVGKYYRFERNARQELIDLRDQIVTALSSNTSGRPHVLVAAQPGSGKSYFAEQLIEFVKEKKIAIGELIDLSKRDKSGVKSEEELLRDFVQRASSSTLPFLAVVDEVDAKVKEHWPFETIYKSVDVLTAGKPPLVFLFMGSGGGDDPSLLAAKILSGERGRDLLDRVAEDELHRVTIPLMSPSDDICMFCAKLLEAALELKKSVRSVDKLACFYAISNFGGRPRQLQDLATKAVSRIDPLKSNLTYDHLFDPGAPSNKEFWYKHQPLAETKLRGVINIGF
ncbi:MAG: HAD-IB family phosphatase [Pirellula sp.]